MSPVAVQTRRKLMVVLTAMIAVVAIVIVAASSGRSRLPESAVEVASRLPAWTSLVLWMASVEVVLEMARDAGLDGAALATAHDGFAEFVGRLGANPLTAEGLQNLGVDTSGGLAFAAVPQEQAGAIWVLYVPLVGDNLFLPRLEELLQKLGVGSGATLERVAIGETTAAWLVFRGAGETDAVRTLLVPAGQGVFALFSGVFDSDNRGDVTQAMVDLAGHISHPGDGTLAELPAFLEATADPADALLAAFLNGSASGSFKSADPRLESALFWGLMGAEGALYSVVEDGASLELLSRTVFPGKSDVLLRSRDLRPLDLVPGHPVAGCHFALDLRMLVSELERTWARAGLGEHPAVHELLLPGPLGLPDQLKLIDLLTGELGLFVGEVSGETRRLVSSSTLFLGVTDIVDEALLAKVLAHVSDPAQPVGGGGTDGVHTVSVLGLPLAVFLADGRLWVFGDSASATAVAAGQTGQLTQGDRSAEVAGSMRGDGGLALFLDLAQAADGLLEWVDDSKAPEASITRLLGTLDSLSGELTIEGRVVEGRFALTSRGPRFRQSTLPAVLAAVDGSFGASNERKVHEATRYSAELERAWQGEAQHHLHKLYYGAATYFETPQTGIEGLPALCHFPDAAAVTPAQNCCAFPDGLCPADAQVWEASPVWRALNFSIASPHYCNYSFQSNGTGPDATFTAMAWCDANCDGIVDVWRMEGRAGASTTETFCEMSGDRRFSKSQIGSAGEATPSGD